MFASPLLLVVLKGQFDARLKLNYLFGCVSVIDIPFDEMHFATL
jgi:hypothetical protein